MRLWRLEFGIFQLTRKEFPFWTCRVDTYRCFCRAVEVGPFYVTYLSSECTAGIYREKGRLYRVKKYLKERKKRVKIKS